MATAGGMTIGSGGAATPFRRLIKCGECTPGYSGVEGEGAVEIPTVTFDVGVAGICGVLCWAAAASIAVRLVSSDCC